MESEALPDFIIIFKIFIPAAKVDAQRQRSIVMIRQMCLSHRRLDGIDDQHDRHEYSE
ncbi:MAG: hypothetical protein ACI4TU_02230 [Candidatus Cryptobacteroides sp.]